MTDSNPGHHLGANDRDDQQLLPDTSPIVARTRDCHTAESLPLVALNGPPTSGHRVVVTIGVDRYDAWPHLGNAVNDL